MGFWQAFQILMTAITPIILALIAYAESRQKKKSSETKALEDQLAAERQKIKDQEEKDRNEKISKISEGLDDLKTEVSTIGEAQSEMKDQVEKVVKLTQYSLEFSTEINNALLNLSERIIDESSDDALRKTMQEHRRRTDELSKKLYEITF